MNIIALSLGLAPVPRLPAEVLERHSERTRLLQRESAREAAQDRRHGPTARAELRELLRTTGPATAGDIQTYYGWSITNTRAHLARLLKTGQIRVERRVVSGRWASLYHYAEDAA